MTHPLTTEWVALSSCVRVSPHFVRSANLRRDARSARVIERYILTPVVDRALRRLLEGYHSGRQLAWTVTGPYGSGKSTFALFITALLDKDHPAHATARAALLKQDAQIAQWVTNSPSSLPILIVGKRHSPARCILEAMEHADGLPPEVRAYASQVLQAQTPLPPADMDTAVIHVLRETARLSQRPLILVFDEMGKTLEYSATHPFESDLYLFQQLSELAPEVNMVFVGILHQAFEYYAQQLDRSIRREWSKVQGRFEDIPFIESSEQMMRLTALALETAGGQEPPLMARARHLCRQLAEQAMCEGLFPPSAHSDDLLALAERIYPLHPATWVALPEVARRYAQNERSLFAFLASYEAGGFQHFLSGHALSPEETPPLYGLHHLYDYLVINHHHLLLRRSSARPIAQAEEHLQHHDCSDAEILVLKHLALLQWLQETSHLRPTREVLLSTVAPWLAPEQLDEALHSLRKKSALVVRHFNRTYRVWQGSDIDIEERLQTARAHISKPFPLARTVQDFLPPRPISARRHSYETGTLRAFAVEYVDVQRLEDAEPRWLSWDTEPMYAGCVVLCLPQSPDEHERFIRWACSEAVASRDRLIVAVATRYERLVELAEELQALYWVQENTPELRDDPVARRELSERLLGVQQEISQRVQRLWQSCRWFWRGAEHSSNRSVSRLLSTVCDLLYPHAPIIQNELINRWALSSAAAAARRNLIQAILTRAHEERLGIDGYPPERSIYESLLAASKLHVPSALGWQLTEPAEDDPLRLRPLWEAMREMVFRDPPQMVNVAEMQNRLAQPPFGLTPSLFPVLLCVFMHVYRDECSLYREGTFLPEPSVADWEVLLRRPELFAVAGCPTSGARAEVLQTIAGRWNVPPKTVPVVRELIRRVRALPEHAKRTRRLSPQALALRDALMQAQSPEQLLYDDIPKALQTRLPAEGADPDAVQRFLSALDSALRELAAVTTRTIEWARDELLKACSLPEGETGWKLLCEQSAILRDRVSNPHLRPLLARASAGVGAESGTNADETTLESVLAYIAGRPPRTWTDMEVQRFPEMAQVLGSAYREAAMLNLQALPLTPEEEAQCEQLLQKMRQLLADGKTAQVRLSVLLRLLHEQTS